jgi:hypothetical protein
MLVGLLLYTAHFQPSGLNPNTVGAYVISDSGFTLADYKNSDYKNSAMAGWTFQKGPFAVTVGAVTGYPHNSVFPVVLPSYKFNLTDEVGVRVSAFPQVFGMKSGGVTFSVEFKIN